MDRQLQKQEALVRLRTMNLHPNVVNEFEKENLVYYSDPMGILYWVDNNPEYVKLIKEFEEKYNAYVYHCILSHTQFGELLSMLYVSDYEEEWEDDRQDLKDGYPYAYVSNITDPWCSEIGGIGIKEQWGGLVRVA